jgi:hypothetical protein
MERRKEIVEVRIKLLPFYFYLLSLMKYHSL